MTQEKHYEMLWDCQFCGTTKLLGKTHRHCPMCGAPQNPDARYFPSDDEKVAVEDHQLVGADKICPSCGGLNAASAVHCGACGSPMDGAQSARRIADGSDLEDADMSAYRQQRDVMAEQHEREMAAAGVETPKSKAQKAETKKKGNGRVLVIVGVVLAAIAGFFFLFSQTERVSVQVQAHEWQREIRIEEYKAVREGAWRESVPISAYRETCSQRQRGTERIPDGQDCRTVRSDNGDGTFSERQECTTRYREEPVYDTWCDYTIDKWVYTRSVTTDQRSAVEPYWGNVSFSCTGTRLGCEREAGRDETYTLVFLDEGDVYRCNYDRAQWDSVNDGSIWSLEVRTFVGGAVCDSLEKR